MGQDERVLDLRVVGEPPGRGRRLPAAGLALQRAELLDGGLGRQ
ncbi:hypothetical protein [Streptomyces sp. NPDC002602]